MTLSSASFGAGASAAAAAAALQPPEMLPQGPETVCHGLLRNPKPGGRTVAAVPMPDPMVFYSWWNEEVATLPEYTPSGQGMGVRKQVRLHYLPKHGSFQLFTDDANAALTLQIEHADGTPVGPLELHVGAKLDVLGRPMTLRSASARTISWIDAEAKRLLKKRDGLCAALAKFNDVHKLVLSLGLSLYLNPTMAPNVNAMSKCPGGGKADIARLHREVEALGGLLAKYRA